LLIFYGQPQYFLDIFILVSRDRKDSEDMPTLLSEKFNSAEIKDSLAVLLGLAVVAPKLLRSPQPLAVDRSLVILLIKFVEE
jgi:hypothetical protein